MKLWLDDIRQVPDGWVWAKTADEALEILARGKVTHISFDHDLGDDDEGTGMTVAKWVEECAYFGTLPRLIWTIHSANPVGRKNIEAAMRSADVFWSIDEIDTRDRRDD